jgi:hypothetical protein
MSGLPNQEDVRQLVAAIEGISACGDKIRTYEGQIASAETQLKVLREKWKQYSDAVRTLMERMDVRESANAGHEGRMLAFLHLVNQQARERGRDEQRNMREVSTD